MLLHVICGLGSPTENSGYVYRLRVGDCLKKFFEGLFFKTLAAVSLVLGLERVCPRKGCPSPWARIFFVSLALASSLVFSTPPLVFVPILTYGRESWVMTEGGGGYSILVNYQSFLSNIFSLAPSPNYFSL